jgi:hypothetical protein
VKEKMLPTAKKCVPPILLFVFTMLGTGSGVNAAHIHQLTSNAMMSLGNQTLALPAATVLVNII